MSIDFALDLSSNFEYRMHPSVPLQILELFYRKKGNKIAGTLLGIVYPGHVDITNCYSVPLLDQNYYNEDDQEEESQEITLDRDYHLKQFELNQKVFNKEVVVGFFITQSELNYDVAVLNSYYSSKESQFNLQGTLQAPIVLTLDPTMNINNNFNIQAYINVQPLFLRDAFAQFQKINLKTEFIDDERNLVTPYLVDEQQDSSNVNNFGFVKLESMEDLLQEVIQYLKVLQNYVKQVKEGKIQGDSKIGKAIKKLVNQAPKYNNDEFSNMVNKYIQDVMLVLFLSNLTNAQSVIAEKLNKI